MDIRVTPASTPVRKEPASSDFGTMVDDIQSGRWKDEVKRSDPSEWKPPPPLRPAVSLATEEATSASKKFLPTSLREHVHDTTEGVMELAEVVSESGLSAVAPLFGLGMAFPFALGIAAAGLGSGLNESRGKMLKLVRTGLVGGRSFAITMKQGAEITRVAKVGEFAANASCFLATTSGSIGAALGVVKIMHGLKSHDRQQVARGGIQAGLSTIAAGVAIAGGNPFVTSSLLAVDLAVEHSKHVGRALDRMFGPRHETAEE